MLRVLALCLLLSGCGLSSLGLLSGGGGPTVNSNAQIGKENRQAVVSYEEETTTSAGRDVITTEVLKEVETGMVDKLNIQNVPPWVMFLLLLGWLLPTPTEIGRGILNFFLLLFNRQKM
jgi:hypothetical protein|tara:strand:- start:35 stop:391 length:357 start_codon:yes stop_codon:yes gene_type:complete